MGFLTYVRRARVVRAEARSAAVSEHEPGVYRPTIPGSSLASAVTRVNRRAGRVLDRRERRAFAARASFDGSADLSIYRRSGRLRVAEVDPTVTPADAYAGNLRLVVQLCEDAGIDHFLVPESTSHRARIGVVDADWQRFVDRLLEVGRHQPVYAAVEGRSVGGRRRRYPDLVSDARIRRAARTQSHLEVFLSRRASHRSPLVFDRPFGCHVERWDTEESGALRAPSRNERTTHVGAASRVPATARSHGQQVRTLRPFTGTGMFEVDFPIDVVFMWVDGSDPDWVDRKNAALVREGLEPVHQSATEERFRDNGELRYSMRSVEQYASWVRHIYVVTDRQLPHWLDPEHPRVTVVDQRDLFGGTGTVPNFNSHAIGARLHHIPGLSEHYLHFNDDFFLARPVLPQLFFTSSGASKFFLSRSTLGFHDEGEAQPHELARRNVVDLLAADFGRVATRAFFHTPIVQRRSTMLELEARYPEVFETTWSNAFRSSSDHEINSWLHHYYGYLTGSAVVGSIRYDYFDVSDAQAWRRMRQLRRSRHLDTFCINDSDQATDEHRARIARWMAGYFDVPAAWERPDAAEAAGSDADDAADGDGAEPDGAGAERQADGASSAFSNELGIG